MHSRIVCLNCNLDWVFAYNAIFFARNMFMHYHALLFSFPSFLSISSIVFSFLLLLLRLSSMAPKKSIPSKNPISHCGSSSSSSLPSIPNKVRFWDMNSQKDFVENFYDWAIHSEHQVIMSDFPDTPLPDYISSRALRISLWETLEESLCVYTRVPLQHTCHQYLCSSVYYSILSHTYRSNSRVPFRYTTCP